MSIISKLEAMVLPFAGYHGGDSNDGGSGSDNNTTTGLPTYSPPAIEDIVDNIISNAGGGRGSVNETPQQSQQRQSISEGNATATVLEEESYATDSQGNYVRDSQGNPVETPVSRENFENQQETFARQAAQAELEAKRLAEQQALAFQQTQDRYLTDAFGDFNNQFAVQPPLLPQQENLPAYGYTQDEVSNVLSTLYSDQDGSLNEQSVQNFLNDSTLLSDAGLSQDKLLDPTARTQAQALYNNYGENSDIEYNAALGQVVQKNPNDEFATYWNNIGQAFAGKVGGLVTGGLLGDLAFSLFGSDMAAVEPALYADAIGGTLTGVGLKSAFSNANIYKGADGQLYINDTLVNPFTGESTPNYMTLEEKTQKTIEMSERQQASQASDDYQTDGISHVLSNSTGDTINWRDYRNDSFSMTPGEIINAAIGGVNLPPEVVDAARFTGRVASGDDPVQAALSIYGDNITSVLPEDMQKPTQAAVRVGLGGENRVAVLGDIYGGDIGIDTPLEKAGLEGATIFDQTGDKDQAMMGAVKQYIKEDGDLLKFNTPKFLEGSGEGWKTPDWLKEAGASIPDIMEYLPRINGAEFNDFVREGLRTLDPTQLKKYIPKIDFEGFDTTGMSVEDFGDFTLPELNDMGVDVRGLDLDVDFGAIGAGLAYQAGGGGKGVVVDSNDEFQSLDSPFELSQDDESLARDLIAGRI